MSRRRCETSFEPLSAVAEHPAQVEVGEVGVGAAFGGGHTDLGRGRMVVELDEKAFEQFAGRFAGEGAGSQALFVERQQVLIEVPGVEGIPSVQLGDDGQVAEPVVLEGLVEIARGLGRDVTADLGDLEQLRPALGALLPPGQFGGQGGVAFGKEDEGVA